MVLIGGDDQPTGVGLAPADDQQLVVGLAQHVREPLALDGIGGAQALARPRGVERVVEPVGVERPVRGAHSIIPSKRGK